MLLSFNGKVKMRERWWLTTLAHFLSVQGIVLVRYKLWVKIGTQSSPLAWQNSQGEMKPSKGRMALEQSLSDIALNFSGVALNMCFSHGKKVTVS